jgi:membrane-associated phospholipid phosphatase
LRSLDERLLLIARTHAHSARAERAVGAFSRLGEHAGVWLALGTVGARRSRGHERALGFRRARDTVLITYALNALVKRVVRRRRPELEGLPALTSTPSALSFPSAHASTSFAGAISYSRLGLPALPLYALAGALSLSRVYLGVHYPSDVLGGAVLGAALARLRAPARTPPLRADGAGRERAFAPSAGAAR